MKIVYLFVLIPLCYGGPIKKMRSLKQTDWYGFSVDGLIPPTLKFEWAKVHSTNAQDPVIGYKVNIWEVTKIKQYKSILQNNGKAERVQVEEYPRAKRRNGVNIIPKGKHTVMETPADSPMIYLRGVKLEVPYQFTVTAFTRKVMGPASAIVGFTAHGPDWRSASDK